MNNHLPQGITNAEFEASSVIYQPGSWNGVSVRPANPCDAEVVAAIASAVDIRHVRDVERGFLVHARPESSYREHIEKGHLLYICVDGRGIPLGFVCGYVAAGLKRHVAESNGMDDYFLEKEVLKWAHICGDWSFVLVYQMAVLPHVHGRGMGRTFFELFCQTVPGPYYGAVLESPLLNPKVYFWQGRGFRRIGQGTEHTTLCLPTADKREMKHENLVWGIYRRDYSSNGGE